MLKQNTICTWMANTTTNHVLAHFLISEIQYKLDYKNFENKISNLTATISALENHCSSQDAKYSALQAEAEKKISHEIHEASLFECKR